MLDADLWAGRSEALANGFLVETGERHRVPARLDRAAVARDLLPIARTRYHAALAMSLGGPPSAVAWHWLVGHDPHAARAAAIEAAAFAGRPPRRGRRAGVARARAVAPGGSATGRSGQATRGARLGPRRPPGPCLGGGLRGRPDVARDGLSRIGDRWPRRAARPRAARPAPRTAGPHPPCRRRSGRGDARRPAGGRARARASRVPERATVLAALAQLKMLDGIFSEAQRLARDAIKVARACDPVARAQEVHATTTLAVALAWGKDPAVSIELLREAEAAARELDDPDALFRIRANLTTVLDLVSRRTEAVEVAYEGIEDARRAGLEAVYGNFLAGNVADTLFLLGRWPEARAVSERAMSWLPVGVVYLACVLQLAIVEIEMDAGENAVAAARPDDPRVRCRPRAAAGRPVLPRHGLVRAVARRRRRCQPLGRPGLGGGACDRGVAARRADGLDGRPGRCGHRGRGAPATASSLRWPPRASGRTQVVEEASGLVRAAGAPTTAGSRRSPRRRWPPRGPSSVDSRARTTRHDLAARGAGLGGARRPVRRRARPLAPGRGDPGRGHRAIGPGPGAGAAPRGRRARPAARRQAAPARVARAGRPGPDRPAARGGRALDARRPPRPRRRRCGEGDRRRPTPAGHQRNGRSDLVRAIAGDPRARPSAPTRSGSADASARSSAWSPRDGPTARSGSGCSSARRRSASTSGTSWPSSRSPAGSRPPRSRSGWA